MQISLKPLKTEVWFQRAINSLGNGILQIELEVNRISASVSVSATSCGCQLDKWALSADIRFLPKAVVPQPHSVHFRFRCAAVGW